MRDQVRDDIRVTAENVISDAKAITAIEERKLDPNASVEELEKLSDDAAELAIDLVHKATVEQRLVDLANAQDRLRRAGQQRK
jgi:hypothetical protein